jgi:hypothetical protein
MRDSGKKHTVKRTPIPVKIVFTGENVWGK